MIFRRYNRERMETTNQCRSWISYANWALFLTGIGWVLWDLPYIVLVLPTDFEYYYKAALNLSSGEALYYNWMAESVREGIGSWYLYPPYFAGGLVPLTGLGHIYAKMVFAGVVVIALIGVDRLLVQCRKCLFPNFVKLDFLIHGLVFFTMPTRLAMGSLQIEGCLFVLFLLTLYWTLTGKSVWGVGIVFIPGVLIKLWPGPYGIALLAVWKKRIWIPMLTVIGAIVVPFTMIYGFQSQYDFLFSILPVLSTYADPYKDNQSLTLYLSQMTPLSIGCIQFLRGAILLSFIVATYIRRNALYERDARAILLNAGWFVSISLLLTPTAWTAAHLRLLLPMILACGFCMEEGRWHNYLSAMTFFSLMFYVYPQEFLKTWLPPIIVRYPLLYATLLMYAVFGVLVFSNRPSTPVAVTTND